MTELPDPTTLVARVRSDLARPTFEEAVRAYKAGLYKACIILIWQAVVYDYISKLEELSLAGETRGKASLGEYERLLKTGDVNGALTFERNVVTQACDIHGFIAHAQKRDFERLVEDRHRAAHPLMNSVDEPFTPSAELALLHLRSAVEGLLSRQPVHSKATCEHLLRLIASPHFATNAAEACRQLEDSPLMNSHPALAKSLIHALVGQLLNEDHSENNRAQRAAALLATQMLHPEVYPNTLKKALRSNLHGMDYSAERVLALLWFLPDAWALLTDQHRIALIGRVRSGTPDVSLLHACRVPALQPYVLARHSALPNDLIVKASRPGFGATFKPLLLQVATEGDMGRAMQVLEQHPELPMHLSVKAALAVTERLLELKIMAETEPIQHKQEGVSWGALVFGLIKAMASLNGHHEVKRRLELSQALLEHLQARSELAAAELDRIGSLKRQAVALRLAFSRGNVYPSSAARPQVA